jgi:hypothetical protein
MNPVPQRSHAGRLSPHTVRVPRRRGASAVLAMIALGIAAAWCVAGAGVHASRAHGAATARQPADTAPNETPPAIAEHTGAGGTQAQFRNVDFDIGGGIVLDIARLRGELASKQQAAPIAFDDKTSFVIHIASAEVGLSMESLDSLMNGYVFAYRGAPLKHLKFSTDSGKLIQEGTLHKVVDIPFRITAVMSMTPEGLIRVHPVAIKIFKVNGRGLMKALGVTLASLLDLKHAHGVSVEKNDLLLDPQQLLPPPAIAGRVTAVRVEPNEVVQVFGDSAAAGDHPLHPPETARNYMYFHGGTLHFGKLYMVDADMQIIDQDPADAFQFSIDKYNSQLVAGYSKNTPSKGLVVFMPDLAKAQREQASRDVSHHR